MLRRLVLAPVFAALAFAMPMQPASADYEVLCVWAEIVLELNLPGDLGRIPKACAPLVVPVYEIIDDLVEHPPTQGLG